LQGFLLAKPMPPDQLKAALSLGLPYHQSRSIAPTIHQSADSKAAGVTSKA
jgi:hypothetical protein